VGFYCVSKQGLLPQPHNRGGHKINAAMKRLWVLNRNGIGLFLKK